MHQRIFTISFGNTNMCVHRFSFEKNKITLLYIEYVEKKSKIQEICSTTFCTLFRFNESAKIQKKFLFFSASSFEPKKIKKNMKYC